MRELIIYLEPTCDTPLRQCLDYFLLETAPNYYPSTAIKYPPHISVTGFFKVNDQAEVDIITTSYDQIIDTIIKNSLEAPMIDLTMTPILVPIDPPHLATTRHLLLPVTVPTRFHSLLNQCAKDQKTLIRPKRMDHISLAYWDEPKATSMETEAWLNWCNGPHMEKMKRDLTEQLDSMDDTTHWTMVLYERTHQGVAIGEKHQFKALYRWLIS